MSLWTLVLGVRLAARAWEDRGWFEPWLDDFVLTADCALLGVVDLAGANVWGFIYAVVSSRSTE